MTTRDVASWMKSARFILGVYNVEDMIQIPGTRWIIGSGVINNGPGMADKFILKDYLHLFDAETETGGRVESEDIAIRADTASYPETTTPPDWETFSPHGIGLGARDGDVITLYAINHGVREAVEVFKIDVSGKRPRFTWVGSVLAPADGFIDAVAWIPGTDGFVVTSLLDPRDPEGSAAKQMKGEPNGWVREWHPKSGWKTLLGTESFSTPNGVIVSNDGHHVFVAASTGAAIYRGTRGGSKPEVVSAKVAGLPDNIRWSADGKSILIANHTAPPEEFAAKQIAARQQHKYDLQYHAHGSGQHENRDRHAQRALWRIRRRNHRDRGRQSTVVGQLQVGSGRDLRPQSVNNTEDPKRTFQGYDD